jgi:hypothetical protein
VHPCSSLFIGHVLDTEEGEYEKCLILLASLTRRAHYVPVRMGVPAVSALYFQRAWSHAWHHLACVDHHVLVAIPILKWLRLLGPDYANHSCFIAARSRLH